MEISFIVPMYNSYRTIERCIKSILEQLDYDDELIIINDGSIDDSLIKAQSLASKNPLIKIYSQENIGVGETRNRGVKYASKKWITFVDSDDYLDKEFKHIIKRSLEDGMDVVLYEHIYEDAENNYTMNGKEVKFSMSAARKFAKNCLLNKAPEGQFDLRSIWANVYSREFILRNQIAFHSDVTIGEDMLFMLEIFKCATNIKFVNSPVYHYFFCNKNSLTNQYKPQLYDDIKKLDEYIWPLLNKEDEISYYFYRMNDIILLMKYTYFNKENNCKYFHKRKEFVTTIRDGKYKEYYKILCENKFQKKYDVFKRITFYIAVHEMIEILYVIFKIRYWRHR